MDERPESPMWVRATYLAEALAPGSAEPRRMVLRRPVLQPLGAGVWAVLFRYGAVVTVGLGEGEHAAFLEGLSGRLVDPLPRPETEVAELRVAAGREVVLPDGVVVVPDLTPARILVLGEVLARSALLAFQEQLMAEAVERVEPLAHRLRSGRRPRVKERSLLQQTGETLLAQLRMVGRAEVVERPEVLWDSPDLGPFYDRLAVEYELADRDRALARKADLVGDVSGTLFDLLQERQVLRVEWYIVALIVVEIGLTLWEMAHA